MEVDPITGSGSGDTSSTADEAQTAEKFLETVSEMFTLDLVFDFMSENEDEG